MEENISNQILAELKKLNKLNKLMSIIVLVLLILLIASFSFRYMIQTNSNAHTDELDSWSQVSSAMDKADFDKALEIALHLNEKTPDYYYNHVWLGSIYVAINNLTEAEKHYARAYELFPAEDIERDLNAVRKALKNSLEFSE